LHVSRLIHLKWVVRPGAKVTAGICLLLLAISGEGCKETVPDTRPPDVVRQIVMKKWAIEPQRVEVVRGQEVELDVSTSDVEHGLAVPGLGIREPVQPGKPAVIRFKAEKAGSFPMRCSILCGRGHDQMTGEIVVTNN
jgi:cytochrome c oxidase subunit II